MECNYAAIEEMGINKHVLDEGTHSATMLQKKRWVSTNTFWMKAHRVQLCCNRRDEGTQSASMLP